MDGMKTKETDTYRTMEQICNALKDYAPILQDLGKPYTAFVRALEWKLYFLYKDGKDKEEFYKDEYAELVTVILVSRALLRFIGIKVNLNIRFNETIKTKNNHITKISSKGVLSRRLQSLLCFGRKKEKCFSVEQRRRYFPDKDNFTNKICNGCNYYDGGQCFALNLGEAL